MVDMLKFPTVSAGDMVTLMQFGEIKMKFSGTFQTFSPAFTNAFVVFLLSFLFVGFKILLAIKFAVAVWTFKGWLDPCSINLGRSYLFEDRQGSSLCNNCGGWHPRHHNPHRTDDSNRND